MKEANDNATDTGFLSCPFCEESEALKITSGSASASVVCNCCLAAGGESDSISGAIQAWNTRAPDASAALNQANAKMLTALKDIILWAERHGLTKADLITGGKAEVPVITNARLAIAQAEGGAP